MEQVAAEGLSSLIEYSIVFAIMAVNLVALAFMLYKQYHKNEENQKKILDMQKEYIETQSTNHHTMRKTIEDNTRVISKFDQTVTALVVKS